ncbi:MAG: 2-C-methyl-D-erythritol 2,4-cyclodiphosphate synthase [Rikenellaceae bacterium]
MKFRIGEGFDVHILKEGLTLTLGGVVIPHSHGCVAHSDGDVLIHAICDALLGGAALGDIGLHFPDTSSDFENIDSKILLKHTCDILAQNGYHIGNIDSTIRMQRPKLRPHIDTMRNTLAEVLSIDSCDISIKATTTEKLGFEGREEGVSASAIALIYKI